MSPILVTGASGFVGRHVMTRAAARGLEAVAAEGDFRDADVARALMRRIRPSAVVHLAAGPRATATVDDELRMTDNVLAGAGGAPVVIAGSAAQYGMGSAQPLPEDAPTVPLTPYGKTKCAIERRAMSTPAAHVIFARSFNIVGPGQGVDAPVPSWAAQLARGAATLRTGKLDVVRDFLDVRDVADAFLDLVESGFAGIVNVGSGTPVRLRAVVDGLITAAGTGATAHVDPALARAQDPPHVVADVARLRGVTGFRPRRSLDASLADVLAEWRERSTAGMR